MEKEKSNVEVVEETTSTKRAKEDISIEEAAKIIEKQLIESEVVTKKVVIKASPNFVITPKEIESEAYVIIGCPLKGKNVYIPLEAKELAEVAPQLFGLSVNDSDFVKEVRNYFASYRVRIDYSNSEGDDSGKVLELPIDKDGNVVFHKDYVEDIIAYRTCMQSPKVAKLSEDVRDAAIASDSNFIAYIEDTEAKKIARRKLQDIRREADINYLKYTEKSKAKELNWIIRVLSKGVSIGANERYYPSISGKVEELTLEDKRIILSDFRDNHPGVFNRIVKDPNLEIRATIEELIESGVLTRAGNVIKYRHEVIGGNIDEAIDELRKPSKSNLLVELKAALRIK